MNKKLIAFIVIIIVFCGLVYLNYAHPTTKTSGSALTIDSLKDTTSTWGDQVIPYSNYTYDGSFFEGKGGNAIQRKFSSQLMTASTTYAVTDFDNDGSADIFAVQHTNSGGSGIFYELLAFQNIHNKPQLVGKIDLGDRIKINKISADKNTVTVDIITQGPSEPMCCGTTRQVTTYRFDGKNFTKI